MNRYDLGALSPTAELVFANVKVVAVFSITLVLVALFTLA